MLAAMVSSARYPGKLLPIVAGTSAELFAAGMAIGNKVVGVEDFYLQASVEEARRHEGLMAEFARLVPGIREEMKVQGKGPAEMARMCISVADKLPPVLVESVATARGEIEDTRSNRQKARKSVDVEETAVAAAMESLEGRLAKTDQPVSDLARYMGRMIAVFAIKGSVLADFGTD